MCAVLRTSTRLACLALLTACIARAPLTDDGGRTVDARGLGSDAHGSEDAVTIDGRLRDARVVDGAAPDWEARACDPPCGEGRRCSPVEGRCVECSSDTHCGEDEHCDLRGFTCAPGTRGYLCGPCTPEQTWCGEQGFCDEVECRMRCPDHGPCSEGLICFAGIYCQLTTSCWGPTCELDSDCDGYCRAGFCYRAEHCVTGEECPVGYRCHRNRCVVRRACRRFGDCVDGEACVAGACVATDSRDACEPCRTSADCAGEAFCQTGLLNFARCQSFCGGECPPGLSCVDVVVGRSMCWDDGGDNYVACGALDCPRDGFEDQTWYRVRLRP